MVNIIKKSLLKSQRGGMLVELMLSITIAAIILPFIVRYQQNAISRAKNIAVAKQIEIVQNALERYINQRKNEFLDHVGNHNWKVKISELKEYGLKKRIDVMEVSAKQRININSEFRKYIGFIFIR